MAFDQCFDKVFCLNLERRHDRWKEAYKNIQHAGFNHVERFPAVDSREIEQQYFSDYYKAKIATLLSKLNLIKYAYQHHYASILVFEDDIYFDDDFSDKFLKAYNQLPLDWDLFFLGGNDREPPVALSRYIKKLSLTYSNHAFAISSKAYDPLIRLLQLKYEQIAIVKKAFKNVASDLYIASTARMLNHYGAVPYMVWQQEGYSDIEHRAVNYNIVLNENNKQYKTPLSAKKRFTRKFKLSNQDSFINRAIYAIYRIPFGIATQGINLIIFSKNRAMQIDTLLESIVYFKIHLYDKINVIYTTSSPDYDKGYEIVSRKFPGINFIKEQDFCHDVMAQIDFQYAFTAFLTDDDMFCYRLPLFKDQMLQHISYPASCFLLKSGLSGSYVHFAGKYYKIENYQLNDDHTITWGAQKKKRTFNAPLSAAGCIYKTPVIYKVIRQTQFTSPGSLESHIQKKSDRLIRKMTAFKNAILIDFSVINNPNNEAKYKTSQYPDEKLNKLYLEGYNIDFDNLSFDRINNACYNETELPFKKDKKRIINEIQV